MEIIEANISNLDKLAELFDQYRIFYHQDSNYQEAKKFLHERIKNQESRIFLAQQENEIMGFVQLFSSFTSVGLDKIWILNDLYVKPAARKKGIGELLMNKAFEFTKETGYKKIVLQTDPSNTKAQSLYEKAGFKRDPAFIYEKFV